MPAILITMRSFRQTIERTARGRADLLKLAGSWIFANKTTPGHSETDRQQPERIPGPRLLQ